MVFILTKMYLLFECVSVCVSVIFVHIPVSVFRLLCALTEETCASLATVHSALFLQKGLLLNTDTGWWPVSVRNPMGQPLLHSPGGQKCEVIHSFSCTFWRFELGPCAFTSRTLTHADSLF